MVRAVTCASKRALRIASALFLPCVAKTGPVTEIGRQSGFFFGASGDAGVRRGSAIYLRVFHGGFARRDP